MCTRSASSRLGCPTTIVISSAETALSILLCLSYDFFDTVSSILNLVKQVTNIGFQITVSRPGWTVLGPKSRPKSVQPSRPS